MKPKSFRWSVAGGVGRIVLDRPATLNSLTFEVYAELRDLFRLAGTQKDVRVLTITGSGKGFCSGGDREEIIAQLLGKNSEEHITQYGAGVERRLTGLHETAPWTEFSYGVSNRGASVRIPWQVEKDGKGYIEDRRPCANMDPYVVTRLIMETVSGGY